MVPNPCCCCTLQTGTKVVAIINIVLSVLALVGVLFALLGGGALLAASGSAENEKDKEGLAAGGIFVLVVSIVSLVLCVAYLILSIILMKGANERNYGKCRLWLIISIIFLVLYVLDTARDLYNSEGHVATGISRVIVGILIFLYEIWVVFAFMQELKEESGSAGYSAGRKNDV